MHVDVWHEVGERNVGRAGLLLIGLIVLLAIFAPVLTPYSPRENTSTQAFSRPSADHECVCRHLFHSLTIPRRISVFPDRILISPSDRPDSRANISAIFAKQNPP